MNMRRLFLAAAIAVASSAAANSANAQCANYGCGMGGWGYWDIGRLYGVLAENVPYYSAFPPVYYSYPVPRTYGYSPFAYPPGVMTPEVEMVEPVAITNPHFRGDSVQPVDVDAAAINQTTAAPRVQPLEIVNPYVKTGGPAVAAR